MKIVDIAKECGVSPQAIRGWCRRNHVTKDEGGSFVITEPELKSIFQHYKATREKARAKGVAKHSETNLGVVSLLEKELEVKNQQIKELNDRLKETTEALANMHLLFDQQQKLQAMSEKNQQAKLEYKNEKEENLERPSSKKWFEFWK